MPLPQIETNTTEWQAISPDRRNLIAETIAIGDFPLTDHDPKDQRLALDQFIETAALILNIRDFSINFHNQTIYAQQEVEQGIRNYRILPPVELSYQNYESYCGIDLYLGLINARLNYPFDLQKLEVISSHQYMSQLYNQFAEEFKLPQINCIKSDKHYYPVIFSLPQNINLELIKTKREGSYTQGQRKWIIAAPKELLKSIKKNILKTSEINPAFANNTADGFIIKQINPSGYIYVIEAHGI